MSDDELSAQYAEETEEASSAFSTDELEGITLQPYTPDRAWAAQAMGLKYGFVDETGIEEFKRTGTYPGALRDCGIVLWLRSLTSDLEIDKAARNPVPAARLAAQWAHEHGFGDIRSEKFWAAYNIFINTMTEVAQAQTTPKS
jgi:hypothetical protein